MSRPTRQRKTERVQVPTRTIADPQLQAGSRPFHQFANAPAFDKHVRSARALERALLGPVADLAMTFAQQAGVRDKVAGATAHAEGRELSPEEKKNEAFMRGFSAALDNETIVDLRQQAVDLLNGLDLPNMSASEVNTALDELFKENFKGVDVENNTFDRESMQRILPEWQNIVAESINAHREANRIAVEQRAAVALDKVNREALASGTLDHEERQRAYFDLYQNSARANEQYLTDMMNLGMETGNYQMLEQLRDIKTWKSGAVAPGGIRENQTKLANAISVARARHNELANVEEEQAAKRQASLDRKLKTEATALIITGEFTERDMQELIAAGASGEAIQNIYRFREAVIADRTKVAKEGKPEVALAAEIALYRGYEVDDSGNKRPIGDPIQYVLDMHQRGAFGTGAPAAAVVSSLVKLAEGRAEDRFTDPVTKVNADLLDKLYPVIKDVSTNQPNAASLSRNVSASRMYYSLVSSGVDGNDALRRVREAYPPSKEDAKYIPASKADALRGFLRGEFSNSDLTTYFGGASIADAISQLVTSGQLQESEAASILGKLGGGQ